MCRYWHADAVTGMAFSPTSLQLASGSASELGIWSPATKAVTKQKVSDSHRLSLTISLHVPTHCDTPRWLSCLPWQVSKVTCLAWSLSGSVLAAAHENGCISLRDAAALPTGHIVRHPCAVTLTWRPSRHRPLVPNNPAFALACTRDVGVVSRMVGSACAPGLRRRSF